MGKVKNLRWNNTYKFHLWREQDVGMGNIVVLQLHICPRKKELVELHHAENIMPCMLVFLVGMKEAQTWVDNYRIENTTLHTFDILLNNNKDKGKGWLWECLPKKVRGEDTGNNLNPL